MCLYQHDVISLPLLIFLKIIFVLLFILCHICKLTFPNKTQKLQHKRAAHKYQREIVEQCNLELQIHSQEILKNIYCIEDHQPSSKEYLCKFKNNETDWVTIIADTNPHAIQYLNQQQENITIFDTDSASWINQQFNLRYKLVSLSHSVIIDT